MLEKIPQPKDLLDIDFDTVLDLVLKINQVIDAVNSNSNHVHVEHMKF